MKRIKHQYWSNAQIFHYGDDFFDSLIECIRKAKNSIFIESYIFDNDSLTQNIILELKHARNRGCHVQVLVDGFGSISSIPSLSQIFKDNQIEFRVFRPLTKSFSIQRRTGLYRLLNFFQIFRRLNRRDHRKIAIIDNEIVFIGSFNFTKVHSQKYFGPKAWRDSGVKLIGESNKDIMRAYRTTWQRSGRGVFKRFFRRGLKDRHYHPHTSFIRLNTSLRDRFLLYRDTIRRIKNAKNHVRITTAYFLPKRGLLKSLVKAAKNGAKVEIIIPGLSDTAIVKWAGLEITHNLMKSGVNIYEYQKNVLHAKILTIDDWSCIGSTNFNHRSLMHDLEVEAILTDQNSLINLDKQWHLDLLNCRLLSEHEYEKLNWLHRLFSRLAFAFRYWL